MNAIDILSQGNYIVVHKEIVKRVGLHEAILLGCLCSKQKYWEGREECTEDGFFFCTAEQFEEETTLSPHQQRGALKTLEGEGIIETKIIGLPARKYFKVVNTKLCTFLTTRGAESEQLDTEKVNSNNIKDNNIKENNIKNSETEVSVELKKESTTTTTPSANSKGYKVLKERIAALNYTPETIKALDDWYEAIGKGRVTVKQLEDKLDDIASKVNNDEVQLREAVKNAYTNGWFGFYPAKTYIKPVTQMTNSVKQREEMGGTVAVKPFL